jgi:hypothetical protein
MPSPPRPGAPSKARAPIGTSAQPAPPPPRPPPRPRPRGPTRGAGAFIVAAFLIAAAFKLGWSVDAAVLNQMLGLNQPDQLTIDLRDEDTSSTRFLLRGQKVVVAFSLRAPGSQGTLTHVVPSGLELVDAAPPFRVDRVTQTLSANVEGGTTSSPLFLRYRASVVDAVALGTLIDFRADFAPAAGPPLAGIDAIENRFVGATAIIVDKKRDEACCAKERPKRDLFHVGLVERGCAAFLLALVGTILGFRIARGGWGPHALGVPLIAAGIVAILVAGFIPIVFAVIIGVFAVAGPPTLF